MFLTMNRSSVGASYIIVLIFFSVVLFCAFVLTNGDAIEDSPLDEASVENGKTQLKIIQTDARSPVYGECWLQALKDLQVGCRTLTDDVQSRLALGFANCFLIKSGKNPLPCPRNTPVSQCLKGSDDQSFGAYTAFFTHSQDMCFFLRSQAWRLETGSLINKLTTSSADVAKQLESAGEKLKESSELQKEILDHQASALHGLDKLHSQGILLEENLKISGKVFEEFRESVHSHEAVLLNIFQRLADLQGFILRELSLISTVAFYVLGTILCYLLTSTQRTRDARFVTFMLLTSNAVLEYLICRFYSRADRNWDGNISEISAIVSTWVWALRKLTASAIFCSLAWFSYHHEDLSSMNVAVMKQLREDSNEIRRLLRQLRGSPRPSEGSTPGLGIRLISGHRGFVDIHDGSSPQRIEGSPCSTDQIPSTISTLAGSWAQTVKARAARRQQQRRSNNMSVLSDGEDDADDTGLPSTSFNDTDFLSPASPSMTASTRDDASISGVVSPAAARNSNRSRAGREFVPRGMRDLSVDSRESSPYNLRPRRTPSISGSRAGSLRPEEQLSARAQQPQKSDSKPRTKSASRRRPASKGRPKAKGTRADTGSVASRSPLSESGNLRD